MFRVQFQFIFLFDKPLNYVYSGCCTYFYMALSLSSHIKKRAFFFFPGNQKYFPVLFFFSRQNLLYATVLYLNLYPVCIIVSGLAEYSWSQTVCVHFFFLPRVSEFRIYHQEFRISLKETMKQPYDPSAITPSCKRKDGRANETGCLYNNFFILFFFQMKKKRFVFLSSLSVFLSSP